MLLIWAGIQLALIIFFVPETYHPVILRKRAIELRKQTGEPRWQAPIEKLDRSVAKTVMWSCIRPFQLLFFEPMVSPLNFASFQIKRASVLRCANHMGGGIIHESDG